MTIKSLWFDPTGARTHDPMQSSILTVFLILNMAAIVQIVVDNQILVQNQQYDTNNIKDPHMLLTDGFQKLFVSKRYIQMA